MYNIQYVTENKNLSLPDFYSTLSAELYQKYGVECRQIGYGLFCSPCPKHPNEKYDMLFFDLMTNTKGHYFTCMKTPDTYSDEYRVFDETEISLIEELKKKKIDKNWIQSTRAEVVERHYITNNIILSIRQSGQESYRAFQYFADEGIYKELGPGAIKAKLQMIYEKYFAVKPPITLLSEMKSKVYEYTVREEGEKIFAWDKGEIYYLPGRIRDIEINKVTGEVKFLEKDPVNRPFLSRMNYDFSIDPPETMPHELDFLKKYTTPRFFVNILTLFTKAIVLQGLDKIFINYSRVHGAGKTTLFNIITDVFGDVITKATVKDFYYEFFESTLAGKTILLMEEYKGYSEKVNNDLKDLASVKGTIEGQVKFQKEKVKTKSTLTVALNMNVLKLHENSLKDEAFMQRIVITPFTHIWRTEEYPELTKDQKEKIVLWVVKNLLPSYLSGKLKPETYRLGVVKEWIERYDGVPPDGIDMFLKQNAYKEENAKNTNAVFVSLENAYKYYQIWCDINNYLPVTDVEFEDLMHYAINAEYLFEKDGIEGIYLKKINLQFFL